MATCKDCLHCDVCYIVEHYGVDIDEDCQECDCRQFKDRKRYAEVVNGRWIDAREYCGDFMCSNCDALYGTNKFNYCPNCGTKMR